MASPESAIVDEGKLRADTPSPERERNPKVILWMKKDDLYLTRLDGTSIGSGVGFPTLEEAIGHMMLNHGKEFNVGFQTVESDPKMEQVESYIRDRANGLI